MMKLGNLVAVKYKRMAMTEEYIIMSVVGIIQDIVTSERDEDHYIISGFKIDKKDILGSQVLVE